MRHLDGAHNKETYGMSKKSEDIFWSLVLAGFGIFISVKIFIETGIWVHKRVFPHDSNPLGLPYWFVYGDAIFIVILIMTGLIRSYILRCPHGLLGGYNKCEACKKERQETQRRVHQERSKKKTNSITDSRVRYSEKPSSKFESPIEELLWEEMQRQVPAGNLVRIHRQHPVGSYRLDFAIPSKMVCIELDGHEYHKTKRQRTHDARRDRYLQSNGWRVFRFTGTEVHKDVHKCVTEVMSIAGLMAVRTLEGTRSNGPQLKEPTRVRK
jgi:very-short-patch-repair endonuclease